MTSNELLEFVADFLERCYVENIVITDCNGTDYEAIEVSFDRTINTLIISIDNKYE